MLCRLCLKNNTPLHNVINSTSKCAELTLIESLYWIFGVEVDVNDAYSKYICGRCETVVQYIGSYRTLYQRNQLILEGKLDIQYDFEELIDQAETTDLNEQPTDTAATHTPDESDLNSKRNSRRLKLIRFYYETPTTAIRELLGNKIARKNDDGPLFQVNETVNVEVCKYCSEIFTTERLLDFHYKTKHKSGEKNKTLKFKRLKKKRKKLFTKHKGIYRKAQTFSKKLYPSLDTLLKQTNHTNNPLFDVTHFPNLNFAKQLDSLAAENASKTTDKSKDANFIKDSNDNGENGCTDVEIVDDVFTQFQIVDDEIKTVRITDNCLPRNKQNGENIDQYRWLNLKHFYISVERCVIPGEFCHTTDETKHTEPTKTTPNNNSTTTTCKVTEVQAINDRNISSTLLKWSKTLNEKILAGKTNISSNKDPSETESNCDTSEDVNTVNSDDETPHDHDYLSEDTENAHQPSKLKDLCIYLQRCEVPTESGLDHIANKQKNMKHWKEHISETLLKLQQIKSTDEKERSINIDEEIEILEESDEEIAFAPPVEFIDESSEDIEIQTVNLDSCTLGNERNSSHGSNNRSQQKELKLKEVYVSVKKCPVPHDFYQNREATGSTQLKENRKEPQQSPNWKTNLYETLFKVKEINERFEKINHTKDKDLGTPTETANNKKPLKENCDDTLHKRRCLRFNQKKSTSSGDKGKTKRQTKRCKATNYTTNLNETDHLTGIRDIQIVIPKIDSLLREYGYNSFGEISEPAQQSNEDENWNNPQETSLPRMPQLEQETECKNPLQDPFDEISESAQQSNEDENLNNPQETSLPRMPQLERETECKNPSQDASCTIELEPTKMCSRKSKYVGIIKKIDAEKTLKPNPCKRRKKAQDSTALTEEMEQLSNSLKLIKLKGNTDSDWATRKLNTFEGLPINNWKEKVYRNDNLDEQSIDFEKLMGEEYFLHESNDLVGKKSNAEVDHGDNDKINKKNTPHCLDKEDKLIEDRNRPASNVDDKRLTKTWKGQISNVLLKLKQIKENDATKQVNSEDHLKETDTTEILQNKTTTELNVTEQSTSLTGTNTILPHADENNICQITNDDFDTEKDDVRDKDTSLIEDSNYPASNVDDKRLTKTWKNQISNVLLKLKQVKENDATRQLNSEDHLKETETTEIHKSETTTWLNVTEQPTSLIGKGTVLPHADENNICQITNDDFDIEKDVVRNNDTSLIEDSNYPASNVDDKRLTKTWKNQISNVLLNLKQSKENDATKQINLEDHSKETDTTEILQNKTTTGMNVTEQSTSLIGTNTLLPHADENNSCQITNDDFDIEKDDVRDKDTSLIEDSNYPASNVDDKRLTKTWKNQISNVLLKLKQTKENDATKQVNSEDHLKEQDTAEIRKNKTTAWLNITEQSTSLIGTNTLLPHADENNSCQITNDDFDTEKDDVRDNDTSLIEDRNYPASNVDDKRLTKTWKNRISNVLLKLKQTKENDATNQVNSEDYLKETDTTEMQKNETTTGLNVTKQSTYIVSPRADEDNSLQITNDDFDTENDDVRDNNTSLIENSNCPASNVGDKRLTKTWKNQISDILLKLKQVKENDATKQVNSEDHLKEIETTEIHQKETTTGLNVTEQSTSLIGINIVLSPADENNSCQITNDDFDTEKDDVRDNDTSLIEDSNCPVSNVADKRLTKTWKNQISDILLKLKQVKENDAIKQITSEDHLKETDTTEIDKNETTTWLHVHEQSSSLMGKDTVLRHVDKNNTCQITNDDFDNEKDDT